MAKLKIYGPAQSRASRVIWAARELGLDFDRIDVDPAAKDGDYRKINPNGRFPAIQDGDLNLFESVAINLYLAKTYGLGTLYPANAADEARTLQWALWTTNELEPHIVTCLMERMFKPEAARDAAKAAAAEAQCQAPFKVLNDTLSHGDYVLGDTFTVADLILAATVTLAGMGRIDLSAYPKVAAWVERCTSRPANQMAA